MDSIDTLLELGRRRLMGVNDGPFRSDGQSLIRNFLRRFLA
jgi:hypothetical protein